MKGFTLVEILIVIVIVSFLLIFTLSWGMDFWKTQQIDSMAEEVIQALRRARLSSVSSGSDSSSGVYFDSGRYVLFRGTSYASRDSEEVFLSDASFSGDISEVVFSKLEGMPSNTGDIILTVSGKTRTININSAGRISLIMGDTIPPSDITNLSLSNASLDSIDLSWTAPGDDGSTGTATSYDIRYSTSLITSANWGLATSVSGEPSPSSSGSPESMTVDGLNPGTTYYFAIQTSDEVPNKSGVSNVPSLETLSSTQTTIFYETFSNSDGAWNGSSDTAQDEPGWVTIQGNGDNDDIQVSNEDSGNSPSGGNHLTLEDCDQGFYVPEAYDIAYVSIDLSSYSDITIEYYWQSDDVDNGEGLRVAYSIDSTDGINGTWMQIAEYINPADDVWNQATYSLPNASVASTFMLRFSSRSSRTNEHIYIDDVKLVGYEIASIIVLSSIDSLLDSIDLSWTVPGDDGGVGTASPLITKVNLDLATNVSDNILDKSGVFNVPSLETLADCSSVSLNMGYSSELYSRRRFFGGTLLDGLEEYECQRRRVYCI